MKNRICDGSGLGLRSYVGGLVGYNDTTGIIKDSYSSGFVNGGDSTVSGFIGDNANTTADDFFHDYWDKSTSAISSDVGSGSSCGGGSRFLGFGLAAKPQRLGTSVHFMLCSSV
jgi:hypothetical protein